jgi:hypothetical protein
VPGGAVVEAGLRSRVEDRFARPTSGPAAVSSPRCAAPIPGSWATDSGVLRAALRRVLERLPDGGRALAGHSPTNEAAVLGLMGSIVEPMAKGAGVLIVAEGDEADVESLS